MSSAIRKLLAALLTAEIFCSTGQTADSAPYLLLKLTGSSLDNSRVQRLSVHFVELKGTNLCWLGLLRSQAGNTNQLAVEAILTEALEKDGTRDNDGVLRRKPKSEIVFVVPVESIQLLYGWPTNLALATDFSGWKLASPNPSEIEQSETLPRLLEAKAQAEQIDAIWKEVWKSGDPKIKEPRIEKLSESDVVQRMAGTWTVMFGVMPDKLMISLNTNRLVEVSGRKDGAGWKKRGQWRVISDKLVLFLKEDKLPSFIFVTEQRPYIFDPWAKTMMSALQQEK